ncbi:hypothetical protein D3C74_92130 [compost metagenome]
MTSEAGDYHVLPMEEAHGAIISSWKYTPPYDIYGWLPWEQMKALEIEFGNPELRQAQYAVVFNATGTLCGFVQFFPMVGVTRLGLGMLPDLCGHGQGKNFVTAIVNEAIRRNPTNEIDLEVLIWNERAIRAYQAAGFRITDTYERQTPEGMKPFHCMVYQDSSNSE